jgi:lipopolysaccharide transport system permease protein
MSNDPSQIVTRIRARKGWLVAIDFRELWRYRELVYYLLVREIKGKHRQTALGPLWILLRPVISMLLYTLIFGVVAKMASDGLPYPLFNYSALVPWTFFTTAVLGAANSLLEYREMIKKVYFPRMLIPLVGVLSALVHFIAAFLVLLLLMSRYGYVPGWEIAYLPVYLLLTSILALGAGLWLAPWLVHFHDMANVRDWLLLGWMYATPVVYAMSSIPEKYHTLYRLNPMTNVIQGFRWCLLGVGDPPGMMLGVSFLIAIPILISGALYFRHAERNIVDVV